MANSGTAAKHIIKTFICFFASQYLMNDVCSWCVILHPFLWHTNSFPSLYNHVLCIKLDTLPTQPIPCMPTIFSEPPLPPPILYRPGPYTKMSCNNAELNLHVKAVFPPHQPLSLTRTHFHWVLNVFQCFVYFSHTMPTNAWTLSGCCFRSPWTSDDFCWTFLTPPPLYMFAVQPLHHVPADQVVQQFPRVLLHPDGEVRPAGYQWGCDCCRGAGGGPRHRTLQGAQHALQQSQRLWGRRRNMSTQLSECCLSSALPEMRFWNFHDSATLT